MCSGLAKKKREALGLPCRTDTIYSVKLAVRRAAGSCGSTSGTIRAAFVAFPFLLGPAGAARAGAVGAAAIAHGPAATCA